MSHVTSCRVGLTELERKTLQCESALSPLRVISELYQTPAFTNDLRVIRERASNNDTAAERCNGNLCVVQHPAFFISYKTKVKSPPKLILKQIKSYHETRFIMVSTGGD